MTTATSTYRIPDYADPRTIIKKTIKDPPTAPAMRVLHNLGWSASCIARAIPSSSYYKARLHVSVILRSSNTKQFTFKELFPHLPFSILIDEHLADDFKAAAFRRTDPDCPKKPLSAHEIHLLKIRIMMSWKKKRVAELLKVSTPLVTTYTQGMQPWTAEEMTQLFPSLFSSLPAVSSYSF